MISKLYSVTLSVKIGYMYTIIPLSSAYDVSDQKRLSFFVLLKLGLFPNAKTKDNIHIIHVTVCNCKQFTNSLNECFYFSTWT